MPSSLNIIRQREHRRNRRRRSAEDRAGRVIFGVGFLLSAVLVLGFVAAALGYADLTRDLPSIDELPRLLNGTDGLLLEPTRIYDRSGNQILAVIAPDDGRRTYIPYDDFPKPLVDATLALADERFWKHGGYQFEGWQKSTNHPTLAQRLVSDLLLWNEAPGPRRGLRERLLAAQITSTYGREQVLEWYLNSADYGNSAFGAGTAARLYFGKPVSDLDLSESALLAAVSQAPALNPFDSPESAEELRLASLQVMLAQELISSQEATSAAFIQPQIQSIPVKNTGEETAFINLVLEQLRQRFNTQRIRQGGLIIVTTIDLELQAQTACVIKNELDRISGGEGGITATNGGDCLPTLALPPTDFGEPLSDISASAIVIDPRNGQVLAVVGDLRSGIPGAYLQSHPAGTVLTPLLYLSAFTRGMGPASLSWDIPGGIANFDGQYRGPVRLRVAMVNDILPPAEAILAQMGMEDVTRIAAKFGVELPAGADYLKDEISLSPLDAAAAYGVFANQGTLAGQRLGTDAIHPVTVLRVTATNGAVWADWTLPEVQAVVSPQLAYMLTDILSDENAFRENDFGSELLNFDFPVAIKIGRSMDLRGAWTAGYTPQRVAVVHISAAEAPVTPVVEMWQAVMAYAQRDLPLEKWSLPGGLEMVEVCEPSGLLPTKACPNIVNELFLAGNEPIQTDSLYQVYEVNRETGLLATVFTPLEMVESRTYMIVPPEAMAWARSMNLPVPPNEYDAIRSPTLLPDVHLDSPIMFDEINGKIEVLGTASGKEFSSYRLDYGQGLNPQAWVQIYADNNIPVQDGLLGTWDTGGLNGLYILRLLVVRTNLLVEQSMLVVTIAPP